MRVPALVVSAGFGWLAGMRNLAAPAAVAFRIHGAGRARGPFSRLLGTPRARTVIPALAATEMAVVDKLGITPARTQPLVLLFRIASGAIAGAAAAEIARRPRPSATAGAIVGGLAALVSSYANLALRRSLTARLGTTEQRAGIAEDAVALGLGAALATP